MTAGFRWKAAVRLAAAVLLAGIAGIGLGLFVRQGIPDYLFFRTPFAFLDYEKKPLLVFAENLAMLMGFAFLGGCCGAICRDLRRKKEKHLALIPLALALAALGLAALLVSRWGGAQNNVPSWDMPQVSRISGTESSASAGFFRQ